MQLLGLVDFLKEIGSSAGLSFGSHVGFQGVLLGGAAVAPQWHRSGTTVAPQWRRSGTAVAPQWHRSGAAVAPQWRRRGATVAFL